MSLEIIYTHETITIIYAINISITSKSSLQLYTDDDDDDDNEDD